MSLKDLTNYNWPFSPKLSMNHNKHHPILNLPIKLLTKKSAVYATTKSIKDNTSPYSNVIISIIVTASKTGLLNKKIAPSVKSKSMSMISTTTKILSNDHLSQSIVCLSSFLLKENEQLISTQK